MFNNGDKLIYTGISNSRQFACVFIGYDWTSEGLRNEGRAVIRIDGELRDVATENLRERF